MKLLKITGLVIAILVGLFLIIALFLPKHRVMSAEIKINAPVEVTYDLVNTFKNWPAWSPFHANDSTMAVTYQGPVSGVGAKNTWTGAMGIGSQTITASAENDSIEIDLMFMEDGTPWKEKWTFDEANGYTTVKWTVTTNELSYPLGRYFGIMLPAMMQGVFSQGLENLKAVSEGIKKEEDAGLMSEIKEVQLQKQAVISITDTIETKNIGRRMGAIYGELSMFAEMQDIAIHGSPYAVFHENISDEVMVLEAGFPVSKTGENRGKIVFSHLPGGRAITASQYGPYEADHGHEAISAYISANNLTLASSPWEVYVNDPSTEPDTSKWETVLFYPVK